MLTLWDDIATWLTAPFREPLDAINWLLLVLLSTTIAYGWSKVLAKVIEE